MNKTSIVTLAFTSLLLMGSVTETFAWSKSFAGTRDQVRAACQGPGMVLNEWGDTKSTSCTNEKNGNSVACNDNGSCTGAGSGPMPRIIGQALAQAAQANVAVEAQRTAFSGEIVMTVLKWKLKGKKKVVDAPMEGPTPDPQDGGQPAGGGAAGDAGAPTVNAGSIGQWHATGTGGAPIL